MAGGFGALLFLCYYNSDNDIALRETGVPVSSLDRQRPRSARFQTSREQLRSSRATLAREPETAIFKRIAYNFIV